MRIIIAYASAGTGHRRAAEAIYNYFKENCPRHFDLEIINSLEKTNLIFRNIYTRGYLFLISHALWLWHLGFWLTSISCLKPLIGNLVYVINRINAKNFARFLVQRNPDFIISTHFFPSEIAARLKITGKLKSQLVNVITDFGIHPFWVLPGTDIYIVASAFSKRQLTREGVRAESIKDLGIPIDAKFSKACDRNVLIKKFDLEADKFTVLISTGSFGIGRIEEIVDLLYKEVQILVVCAHNKTLYGRLKKRNYPQVKVFGFIDNIYELMAVSDIIITKPGGLTIAESLAMDALPLFITAIPGQETENMRILSAKFNGVNIKDNPSLKNIVLGFRDHPDKLESLKQEFRELKKPYAAKELCNVICQGCSGFAYRG